MRFDAISHIWPARVARDPDFDFHPIKKSKQEIAFWANRVNTINIAGTVVGHSGFGDHTYLVDFNAQIFNPFTVAPCQTELEAYLLGRYDIAKSYIVTTPPHSLTIEFQAFGNYGVQDGSFFPEIAFLMFGSEGSMASYVSGPAGGVGVTMEGTDLVSRLQYRERIPLFGAGYTGSLVISPILWWPYGDDSDEAGTALYSSEDGSIIPTSG